MPLDWAAPTPNTPDQSHGKLTRAPNSPQDLKRLTFVKGVNDPDDPDRDDKAVKDNYEVFLQEFPKILSALLPEQYMKADHTVPVIIVSHSGFMKENLKCAGKKKPNNNEVWVKDYMAHLFKPSKLPYRVLGKSRRSSWSPPLVETGGFGQAPIDPDAYPTYRGRQSSSGNWPCGQDFQRCSRTNIWMPLHSTFYPDSMKDTACCPEVNM